MPDQFISYPSPSTSTGSPTAARAEAEGDQSVWPSEQFFDPVDFGQYGLFDPEFEQQIASLMYTDPNLPQPQAPYYPPQSNPYAQNAFIMTPASSETTQTPPVYVPTSTFNPALFPAQPTPLPSPPSQPRQHTRLPPLTTSIPRDVPTFLPSPPHSGLPRPHMIQHQQHQQLPQQPQPPPQHFFRPTNSLGFTHSSRSSRQVATAAGEPERFALPVPGDLPGSGCEVIM